MFEDFGAIIAIGARITDPNQNIFQNDETGSVFESFLLNALLLHRSFAILTLMNKVFFRPARSPAGECAAQRVRAQRAGFWLGE